VKFSYFDPSGSPEAQYEVITDNNGKAKIDVDGCVREINISVESQGILSITLYENLIKVFSKFTMNI